MTRFICSQNRTEIETVKKQLFHAGIRSEIRNNPLAAALRVTRLELWLEDERDLFNASKLYAGLQNNGAKPAEPDTLAENIPANGYVEVDEPEAVSTPQLGGQSEPDPDEVSEASALLEKELEQMLERESELVQDCASLRSQVKELEEKLARSEAELARQTETREAAARKHTAEISKLHSALELERKERGRAEEARERERSEAEKKLRSHEEVLKAAEERMAEAVAAQESLQKELLEQKERQKHAYAESLNTLRSKLKAKRAGQCG
jgi:DNA repair exonuclease SbcCD ATPase subunit